MTAATEAMEAMEAAKVASDAAQTAIENLATLQTGETSRDLADAAYMQAKAAADAAAKAQTASDDAAEATDGVAATRLLVAAETARDNAVEAQGMAETQGAAAVAAAMAELKIVGTVKTVGGTDLNAKAPRSVVTTGEGAAAQVTDTGLQMKVNQPTTEGPATLGRTAVAGNPKADTDPYKSPVVNADARTFGIGKLVDSDDDTARLMIVTQYAGTTTVKVFGTGGGDDLTGRLGSDGKINITLGVVTDATVFVTLESEDMYYRASGSSTIMAMSPDDQGKQGDDVAGGANAKDWAKPVEVFSYTKANATAKTYVVLKSTMTDEITGVTTVIYSEAGIHVSTVDRDNDGTMDDLEVTAKIPSASDYKHIHFGAWANLGAAKPSGVQDPADLGIGFVQSIGDGLTGADMPNNGKGEYSGNWVANVQIADEEGDGKIKLTNGPADLTANFGKGTITANLTNLATLKGAISGDTFSGEKASAISNMNGLDDEADFEGSFSGGFYGIKAAEAGGIFNFASMDGNNEGGAFRGAFGADRKDD